MFILAQPTMVEKRLEVGFMNFDEQIIRKGSKSVKWDQAESLFLTTDALPMWVADMDFKAPQVVLDALKERLDHGVFGYAFQDQDTQQAVAEWLKRRHGWSIQTEAVTFTPGLSRHLVLLSKPLQHRMTKWSYSHQCIRLFIK